MQIQRVLGAAVVLLVAACTVDQPLRPHIAVTFSANHQPAPVVPMSDDPTGFYCVGGSCYQGGLYEGGNVIPVDHAAVGLVRRSLIVPRKANGSPSPTGKIVALSIGMSNTSNEWCVQGDNTSVCTANSFMGQASSDPSVNQTSLVLVNGAQGGQGASRWVSPSSSTWSTVASRLSGRGVTAKQVAVIWLKQAHAQCNGQLPDSNADAYLLQSDLAAIIRVAKSKYPNLVQVFLSSRIYGGYANNCASEPYAYEGGFAAKWVVACQITQMRGAGIDPRCGDLSYNTVAPWIAWSAYLWADGTNPRSDGLTWLPSDVLSDGIHPSPAGVTKVADMLLAFFKGSEFTQCWFLAGAAC